MYPEEFVRPMREELTGIGFRELRTPKRMWITHWKQEKRTVLVVVNSILWMRRRQGPSPAIAKALQLTAYARKFWPRFSRDGDPKATEQARSYFTGYPPSSPSIALLRDGKVAFMLERSNIEGRDAAAIAEDLTQAFDRFCTPAHSA